MKPGASQTDDAEGTDTGPSALGRPLALLTRGCEGVAALLVIASLTVTCVSVFFRYVLNAPVTWSDELSGYLVVGIVMFGAAETLRRNGHIQVDLLTARIGGWHKRAAALLGMLMVAIVAGATVLSAWTAVSFSYDFEVYSDGYLEMPMWIPQGILLAGMVLLLVTAVIRFAGLLGRRSP